MKSMAVFEFPLQIEQQIDDLSLDRYVERADRLVAYQQFRAQHHRPRNADALTLASAELVRIAIDHPGGEPDTLEHLADPRLARRGRKRAVEYFQWLGETLPDGHARIEARQRVLEYDLQVAALPA